MSRRNNHSFSDYGPPNTYNAHGSVTPTQGSAGTTHHTRHSTVNPGSYNSQQTSNSEKAELYDPYDPNPGSSSDSEVEPSKGREDHRRHRVSGGSSRLSSGYQGSASVAGHRDGFNWDLLSSRPSTRHEQSSHDHSERPLPTTETPLFPLNAYWEQGENGREMSTTTVAGKERRNPPGLSRSHWDTNPIHGQSESSGRGGDLSKSRSEVTKKRSRSPNEDISSDFFTCDMCNLDFHKASTLEVHLKCNSHWETLEHIQNQNNYDDTAIAFLHEAMLTKVRQGDRLQMNRQSLRGSLTCKAWGLSLMLLASHTYCSRPDSFPRPSLLLFSHLPDSPSVSNCKALQDKDYMTKLDIFHCAPCQVYVSVHPSSLQDHLSSKDHLRNKMEFRTKQLRESVNFAKATMKRMNTEYASFCEGKDPFEHSS
ncbi:DBIRD complex subunit ZNF326 isoform X1 [Oncorhynchus mykiss]|uniref:DBIRD complex subunit ZNF326 isoform X1 n=1 Tax=Oncorhynchus mykiss TaxID=8022 RepID=UPI001878FC16|nr:DBIRD complex subunit ZNF326 isoform X1 [Oncorhynchus mykiss]